jgi:hypothetical protein
LNKSNSKKEEINSQNVKEEKINKESQNPDPKEIKKEENINNEQDKK